MLQFIRGLSRRGEAAAQASADIGLPLVPSGKSAKLAITCPSDSTVRLNGMTEGRGSITIKGTGNVVEFARGAVLNGSIEIQGNHNSVLIGAHCVIRGRLLIKGAKQTVSIGEHTTFQSVYLLCQENCNVTIGRWCMFSRDIEIRTTDAHSVVDKNSGCRINAPASVTIGDHTWVSVGAFISKGTRLASDTIVGANAFVNSAFEESSTIIAGSPAKIVKRGVTWNRSRKAKFTDEELNTWRAPAATHEDLMFEEE